MAVNSTSDTVFSVEDLLARSAKAAATKTKPGGSKIQQMLAGVEEDTVQLSPVARALADNARSKPSSEPYTEQEWFIRARVDQLRAQIGIYQNLPGLDPSGAVMGALEKEVFDLVRKQQAKLKAANDEAAAKQAELDKKNAEANLFKNLPTAEQMIKRAEARARGETLPDFETTVKSAEDTAKDKAVAELLKRAKEAAEARGSSVNTSA